MTPPDPAPPRTPAALGFRMPAEWTPHAATWTSWPFDDDLWEGYLERVREEFTALVATLARFEPVVLNVRDDEVEQDARRRLGERTALANVRFQRMPLNDAWFRDNGPTFVRDDDGRVALVDWRFNAWGEKYAPYDADDRAPAAVADALGALRFEAPFVMEGGAIDVNEQGVCLTTRSCLLSQRRNPNLGEADLERVLADYLGVRHVIWLEGGLEDDHTDGHIDTVVRFVDDDTIVCAVSEDEGDADYATLQRNLAGLKTLRSPRGEPYRVVELPLPRERPRLGGRRLPRSYANFYIANGVVVVPVYGDANDERALSTLRPLFPEREVVGLAANALVTGGGAFHCVTQQQPEGEVAERG